MMQTRMFRTLALAGILAMASGPIFTAEGQPLRNDPMASVRAAQNIRPLAPLVRPAVVPILIDRIEVPRSVEVGEPFQLASLTNIGSATLPVKVEWDFGDGTTASSLFATHTYHKPGRYDVIFRVSNAGGQEVRHARITVVARRDNGTLP
jgi:hypothetical protein